MCNAMPSLNMAEKYSCSSVLAEHFCSPYSLFTLETLHCSRNIRYTVLAGTKQQPTVSVVHIHDFTRILYLTALPKQINLARLKHLYTIEAKHAPCLEALVSYHKKPSIHCLHAAMVGLCCNTHPVIHNHAAQKHALAISLQTLI